MPVKAPDKIEAKTTNARSREDAHHPPAVDAYDYQKQERFFNTEDKDSDVNRGNQSIKNYAALKLAYQFGSTPLYPSPPDNIQTKLTINTPGDEYEQEADAIAEKIMQSPAKQLMQSATDTAGNVETAVNANAEKTPAEEADEQAEAETEKPVILRKLTTSGTGGDDKLQPKNDGLFLPQITPAVTETLQSTGRPLEAGIRSFMEQRFGFNFSKVRIHDGPQAGLSATGLHALAYTYLNNIVFAPGRYRPHEPAGKELLAHELTHVIQQGFGSPLQQKPVTQIRATNLPPAIQRDVPDEEKLLPNKKDNVLAKNLEYWKQYDYAKIMPLRQITPETTPIAYANRTFDAQGLIRKAGMELNGKHIGIDGIFGPETLVFLNRVAIDKNNQSLNFQLAGLGFDVQALASTKASVLSYDTRATLFKLRFLHEWNTTAQGESVMEHFTPSSQDNLKYWFDKLFFDGPVPEALVDKGFDNSDRMSILRKAYTDQVLNGRAALVSANRTFLHLQLDTMALVMRDPGKPSDNPLRISYMASSDGNAKHLETWFDLTYPNNAAQKDRQNIGVHETKDGVMITGMLLSFYLPAITVNEKLRLMRIKEQYLAEKEKNAVDFAEAGMLALIDLLDDPKQDRYILPHKIEAVLNKFFGHPLEFEKMAGLLENNPQGNYFERLLTRTKQLGYISTLQALVQLCNQTRYKDYASVKEATKFLQDLKHDVQSHDYVTGDKEHQGVWLDKKHDAAHFFKVGDITTGAYRVSEKKERLKEAKRAAIEAKLLELIAEETKKKTSDENPQAQQADLSAEKFTEKMVEDACKAVGIKESDIEKLEYEKAFRLKGVESRMIQGVEEFFVDFERVARLGGPDNAWEVTEAGGMQTQFQFEDALGWYKFSNTMKTLEKAVTIEAIIVGGVAGGIAGGMFLAAGGGKALILLGGGAKIVSFSIGISVLIYLIRNGRDSTVGGLLMAALEGYLMAVGFRLLTPLGGGIAQLIGTKTFGQKLVVLLLKSITVGGGSLAFTNVSSMLISDILAGRLHSPGEYLKSAGMGFIMGAMFEFGGGVLGAVFKAAGRNTLQRIANSEMLQDFFTKNSIVLKPGQWTHEVTKAYVSFTTWLGENLEGKLVSEIARDAKEKAASFLNRVAEGFELSVHLQALELIEGGASRQAIEGLEGLIASSRQQLGTAGSRTLLDDVLNKLVADPKRINPFFNIVNGADKELLDGLMAGKNLGDLATSDGILTLAAKYQGGKLANLLKLHFDGHINNFEDWARGLISQADNVQVQILELLETRGASVTPESLLRVAQSGAALSEEVITGLTRMISEGRRRGIKPATIEEMLRSVEDSNVQIYLTDVGRAAQDEFDEMLLQAVNTKRVASPVKKVTTQPVPQTAKPAEPPPDATVKPADTTKTPDTKTPVDTIGATAEKDAVPAEPSTSKTVKPDTTKPVDMKDVGAEADPPQILDDANFSKVKLNPGQDALYILRDSEGNVLKVGKTSATGAKGRFAVYKRAGKLTGKKLTLEVHPLKASDQLAEQYEKALRAKMEGEGNALPWDNTGQRLGKPGFGTPGEGLRTPPVTQGEMRELLTDHQGNLAEVGKDLGVHRRTADIWAKALGLNPQEFK